MDNLLNLSSREQWRQWLHDNHTDSLFCWVPVSIKPVVGTLRYLDAVEEALCYGWIDGVKKKLPDGTLAQRMSPRRRSSSWTELNKERVRRLERLGQMTDGGRSVLPDMDIGSFQIDERIVQRLSEEPEVYAQLMKFPDLYRRVRIDNIQNVAQQPELFANRLETLLMHTRDKQMYGQWHDEGRLLHEPE